MASISSPLDSAEEDVQGGTMYLDSSDLELMHDGADSQQIVGIVFPSVELSADSILVWSGVVFAVDEVRLEPAHSHLARAFHLWIYFS
jgi:hypothetical protein